MKQLKFSVGFTLVELLVVITIVAIFAGIAMPSFQKIIRNQRIKNASFELFASLIVARSEAIKRNGDVTITPVSGGWDAGWKITGSDGTVLKNHSALANIVVSGAPSTLIYKRTGRLSAAASPAIQLDVDPADSEYIRCITIDLSGLPRTIKGECP
ncbi:MAG TPA: GspH/FimT family pseudopilin [Methylotenera sp.]|nr:GspH/FimT family pseudopilin [Methylotenera sp.]